MAWTFMIVTFLIAVACVWALWEEFPSGDHRSLMLLALFLPCLGWSCLLVAVLAHVLHQFFQGMSNFLED